MTEEGVGPALGVLELESTARGVVVADALVKRAPAALLFSRPVSGGKHLVGFAGEVAEVEESLEAALERAAGALVDRLYLPAADAQLWPLLDAPVAGGGWAEDEQAESVAIVETATVCAAIAAADAAVKAADVVLRDVRLAVGIAGKAYFTLTGRLADVEAAAAAARDAAGDRLLALEIVAAPATDIRGRLIF